MTELLDSLLDDIDKRLRAKDPRAVERAAQLAELYPDVPKVWRTLAFAHAMKGDLDGAIAATTRMMAVAPPDPSMFYMRGGYEHERRNLHAALVDYDQGIALSKQLQDGRFLESLHFLRADVLVRLDRKAEALAELEHVCDDTVEWVPEFRSKFQLLAEIEGRPIPWKAMSEPLDSLLEEIENRVHDELPMATERAVQLTEQYPNEPEVWHTLAHVHAVNRDINGAVLAMNRMMDIPPPHPAIFYLRGHLVRGHYEHERGNLQAALADFDRAIPLAEQLQDESRLEKLYFARADVLVGLGRKAEARADLAHVSDGFAKYTTRLRTKEEILADCKE